MRQHDEELERHEPKAQLPLEEKRRRWREVLTLYLIMTLGTLLLDQLTALWSTLASISALLVALGFIFLPTEHLLRRGESPISFGIGGRSNSLPHQQENLFKRSWRSLKQATWISLLVFPIFVLGTHTWHSFLGHQTHFEQRAFTRWSEEIRGVSSHKLRLGELSIGARSDRITLKWRLHPNERRLETLLTLDQGQLKTLSKTRGISLNPVDQSLHIWRISGGRSGAVTLLSSAEKISVKTVVDHQALSSGRYRLGEYQSLVSEGEDLILERDFSWLWSIFLMQLFLVGLPEEIFYRGYLQTRLDSLVGRDRKVFRVNFNWESTILCSALFAIAHLVTILHPSRLAVFFPSLLFGWMRRAYHDTLSPAIFHALCNVLSQLLWGVYALSA